MLKGSKVRLREKRLGDAIDDYSWRCDAELARFDGVPPLEASFLDFMTHYTDELQYPSPRRCRFAIENLDGKHIGNCMYYDIDEINKQAELGILIGDKDYWGKGYGTDAINTLVSHIFNSSNIKRVYLKTLDWNIRAQRCFQKCGFVHCGKVTKNDNNFIVMEIYRSWVNNCKANNSDIEPTSVKSTT